MSVLAVFWQIRVSLNIDKITFDLTFFIFFYLNIKIVRGEEVEAATCDEVLDNLENISSLEVLSGVTAKDEVVAGVQGIRHYIVHLEMVDNTREI